MVFTSAIGLAGAEAPSTDDTGELGYGISQTPQVWLDCQNAERGSALDINWDVREGVFPTDWSRPLFAAYEGLLRRLADRRVGVDLAAPDRPTGRPGAPGGREVNATAGPVPAGLLHEPVVAQALPTPDRVAVVGGDGTMTYGELLARATGVADRLAAAGCQPGDLVGVVMDRGWEQVVGALGILLAGGVYVPVDTNSPPARRDADPHRRRDPARADPVAGWPARTRRSRSSACPVDLLPPAAPRPAQAHVARRPGPGVRHLHLGLDRRARRA